MLSLTQVFDSSRRAVAVVIALGLAILLLVLQDQLVTRFEITRLWREIGGCPGFYDGFCDSDSDCCPDQECDMSWPEVESHNHQCVTKKR